MKEVTYVVNVQVTEIAKGDFDEVITHPETIERALKQFGFDDAKVISEKLFIREEDERCAEMMVDDDENN